MVYSKSCTKLFSSFFLHSFTCALEMSILVNKIYHSLRFGKKMTKNPKNHMCTHCAVLSICTTNFLEIFMLCHFSSSLQSIGHAMLIGARLASVLFLVLLAQKGTSWTLTLSAWRPQRVVGPCGLGGVETRFVACGGFVSQQAVWVCPLIASTRWALLYCVQTLHRRPIVAMPMNAATLWRIRGYMRAKFTVPPFYKPFDDLQHAHH